MTGRGIDQILPHSVKPQLHEPYVMSALRYVELAEEKNGPIAKPVDFDYVWGDALDVLDNMRPDVRIINLETAVTRSNQWVPKGINYRMHPDNIACITAADIDCCALANNHVADWGQSGLDETLATLRKAGVHYAGAGHDLEEATAPAQLTCDGKGRVLVFACGHPSSGVRHGDAARQNRAGVNILDDLDSQSLDRVAAAVSAVKQSGDVVVVSIHWGGNWGYDIPEEQRRFARGLIDQAGVDIVHGHSSHHVKGLEVYNDRLILYGCGDFINDYEGISGYEVYRDDLSLMYFPTVNPTTGALLSLEMVPTRIEKFRVNHASASEAQWLTDVLNEQSRAMGSAAELANNSKIALHWRG
jgi:poly-gamma-glutamate synthesis protein (capsule biosynthesis protein)